ncbi:MAG TPA: S1 RNA-binding domain-containing protein [Halanaerobiaceae bacterium]|jgi:S1 RNA binding domain protein|nr:S1 RNA-binding domain-containing protein [Bacillota bacterium]HHU93363.1 S1 RNA-binding domain-containing protein [Halanaerobiaceae bacterium]HOA40877.1 S1 RNA-binding domain-containing protein [Halanaerobiales bacterium]HPZ62815.1 S1 RNA-binding domain-containing protein [Halanaerobiales bacterium]HQD04620.1 S1 RNA-binding domain-containing protein [Halanaerobiales bacterium]
MSIEVGSTIEGKVTGITKFGAFVELPSGDTGLVHISEVANTYVKDISSFLKPDDTVKVKVIKVGDDGKIGLSIKQLEETTERIEQVSRMSFEDQMNKFLRESNERLQDLKNREAKRGGGSYK